MKIVDMHIHHGFAPEDSSAPGILENFEKAGIWGGCVFSSPPEGRWSNGKVFEERLNETFEVVLQNRERLFPILWIHPYEENIFDKIDIAIERGIDGFKIICKDFYVYEEKSIEVLKYIAARNKPVIFHTGILWSADVASKYNRPLHWEALLGIKGLRFSMGHCSWPWVDECISLYGEFMNALSKRDDTAEMFLDLTPGTPEIYREELLTKIFTVGYDFGNNLLFGTDSNAENYSSSWATHWLDIDRKIMDKLGVSKAVRENMYYNNLMRFLGKSESNIEHLSPTTDDSNAWTPYSDKVNEVIEYWYNKLDFPKEYDGKFKKALAKYYISDAITIENYDRSQEDGERNLLSYLFMCEALKEKYEEKGIDTGILYDTLSDIVIWTNTWSDIKGGLYLGELGWLAKHMSMKLFKLGRLQFCFGKAECDIPDAGVKEGDDILEIHIPAAGPLSVDECKKSIEKAKEFFAKYYPEYNYKCFTCHSWLLDSTLTEMLSEESNIIKFGKMFTVIREDKADDIITYVFRWDTTRRKVKDLYCPSSLAKKVRDHVLAGGDFFASYGYIKK